MAYNSLTVDDANRHMSYLQIQLTKKLHALQGLLFAASEMFQLLRDMDIDENCPALKKWCESMDEFNEKD